MQNVALQSDAQTQSQEKKSIEQHYVQQYGQHNLTSEETCNSFNGSLLSGIT